MLVGLLLPFVLFFWMAPGIGPKIVGNDYLVHAPMEQMETQFALSRGEFPLFVPGYVSGTSVATLTMSQLWHPVSHLTAHLPGFSTGHIYDAIIFVDLLELGLTHLFLYLTLRRLGLGLALSYGLSLVTVYNLRMLDCLRFGASLDGYLGMLWLSCSLVWSYLEPGKRRHEVAVVLSTYLTVVSGHPQMAYYGLVGAACSWLVIPFLVGTLRDEPLHKPYFLKTAAAVTLGGVMASCYALPFAAEFLQGGTTRTAITHEGSLMFTDSLAGTLNNFVWPFQSDVHSAFGGSVLLLVGVLAPLVSRRRPPLFVVFLGLSLLSVLLFSLGDLTPLHEWLWRTVPFQTAMRSPGRANMVVPVLLLWLLVWAFGSPRRSAIEKSLTLVVAGLLVLGALPWSTEPSKLPYPPARLHDIPQEVQVAWLVFGVLGLLTLLLKTTRPGNGWLWGGAFVVALTAQTGLVLAYGTWIVDKPSAPRFEELRQAKAQHLRFYAAYFGAGMYPPAVMGHLERTHLQPELARLFPQFETVPSREEAYRVFRKRGRRPDLALVESQLGMEPSSPVSFQGQVHLESSAYNRLLFGCDSKGNAIFSLAFPYQGRWRAFLDGVEVETFRCNGLETGVALPAGEHRLEFRYDSLATRVGLGLSLFCLLLTLSYGAGSISRAPYRWGLRLGLAMGCALAYWIWWGSLYSAPSLNSHHDWSYNSGAPNLAYGRPTSSSETMQDRIHVTHSSRAVDGDAGTFFLAPVQERSWWQVELGGEKQVSRIQVALPQGLPHPEALLIELLDQNGQVLVATVGGCQQGPKGAFVSVVAGKPILTSAVRLSPRGKVNHPLYGLSEVRIWASKE